MVGFFQSEKYFLENKELIVKNILKNTNIKIRKLEKEIDNKSILIGLRLYEEAPKNIKKKFGGIENIIFYKNSIKKFKKQILKPKIFFLHLHTQS